MADKKITELPFITDVTASVGTAPANTTVIPVVLYGTTNQITADNLKDNFIREVRATVAGVQTYTSSLKGAVTVRGNGIEVAGNLEIGGNVSVKGTLHTQYETSSIIYSSGSTKFGNSFDDLHEFTGSIYFTGSHTINGEDYTYYSSSNSAVFTDFSSSNSSAITSFSSSNSTLYTNFSSSNSTLFTNFSSSNSTLFTNFSSSNSSYNTTFSSSNATYITALSSSNSTYNTTFSSSNATYVTALSSSNSSYNTNLSSSNSTLFTNFSSSNSSYNTNLSSSNSTLFTNFSSSNSTLFTNFSSSNSSYNTTFSSSNSTTFTNYSSSNSSYNTTFSSSNSTTFTNYSSSTANSIAGLSSGVSSELVRVYQTTSSLNIFTGSQDSRNFVISQFTSSTNNSIVGVSAFTSSQLAVNLGNAIFTSSARIELNSIEAYTASLKGQAIVSSSTQVQNYDLFALNSNLYNGTGSIKAEVAGIESYTASLKAAAIVSSSTQVQNYDVFALNSNLYTSTGSLIGITNGLMAFTAALDSTYATDAQLYQLYQATQSLELTTGSLIGITNGLMAFTAALDSTYATDAQLYQLYAETASIKAEMGGIEAYTASLKGAAIVSSSQQITNYYKFAETASANTFYGTQTFVNTETTFNFNPQTSLLASYNYLNFGGGSIMYRNASDIYIGSNAKYGSAGTVVANYTSANGMGMLTMDGALLRYQATDVSVTAGNTYGVPIRFAINGDGNIGVNTTAPVASFLTGSLTIRKSYNNDIASVPSTTAQSYYSNQSGLYLFGRNSGISIIGGNSEEATICYGNSSTHRFASISVGTGTDAVGGDLYVKVGSDTERLRIAATTGNLTVSTGNLVIGTSGKGIDFSATSNSAGTMTSELLNDYEEGTFTPTIKGSTTAGTGTYTVQQGTYTKIGNLVTINVWLNWSGHTGTGDMLLANFPFTSISTTNYRASGTFGWIENLSLTANNLATMAITPSSTEASVTQYPVGGGAATSVPIDTSANIHFSMTYQTA